MENLKNNSHGGNIWPYIKQNKSGLIDFSVNINPLGPSPKIKPAIIRNSDKTSCYPEPGSKKLKTKLASLHRLSPGNILISNGSIELIYLIPRITRFENILIDAPAFSEYEFSAKSAGRKVIFVTRKEKNNFKIDFDKFKESIPRDGLVFLCNPNNPLGSFINPEKILFLLKLCRKNRTILAVDEAFIDFTSYARQADLIPEAARNRYLLLIRSLTKFFSIPGLRLGYLVGHKAIVNQISRLQYPWNVNLLAQITAEEALEDKKYIKQSRYCLKEQKKYLFNEISGIKEIKIYPSEANFFLCKLNSPKIEKASFLSRALLKKRILIRDCGNFRGLSDKFFRIAVKNKEDNQKLILALKGLLK